MDKPMKLQLAPDPEFALECKSIEVEMVDNSCMIDNRLDEIDCQIEDLDFSIDKLTNHADKLYYIIAVASGILTGLIDTIFVGKWDFANAKAWSNKEVNEQIIEFAQKDPEYEAFIANKRGINEENRLSNAVEFLEKKFKLPGDSEWNFKESKITSKSHHLDDFCHHPTLIGLICCIVVQFSNDSKSIYYDSSGNPLNLPITVNDYGKFVGRNKVEKLFSGIINWFINIARTMANRKGHLLSDMGGSYSSIKRKTGGMGIPGAFLSTMKELSSLKCFKDTDFPHNLQKAFQHGIGDGKNQVSLGIFNALFEGASSKFDMRTEMAVGHELKRQAIPVLINETLVRASYFVRSLITELKKADSVLNVNWNNIIPLENRTIERMMTIASGTFCAIDALDAVVEGAINSKANWVEFGRQVVLRLNFVGIGRFTIALGTDAIMGFRKGKKSKERMLLKAESLYLLEAKLFYGDKLMWSACKDANKSIDELSEAIQRISVQITADIGAIQQSIHKISGLDENEIEKNNQGLTKNISDIL